MTDLKKLIARQKQVTEELIAEAEEYYARVGPTEVAAVFGESTAMIRVPFIHPRTFDDIAEVHPPRPGVAVDAPLWFNLNAVTRAYPGVTVVVDGEEDDMFRVRDKEAVYIWPELFDQMAPEDQANLRMAVWALNVWEPQQRREAKYAGRREAEKSEVDHE